MKWISVKDRLPEYHTYVLVAFSDRQALPAMATLMSPKEKEMMQEVNERSYEGIWFDSPEFSSPVNDITHWMPLPPLPNQGTNSRASDATDDATSTITDLQKQITELKRDNEQLRNDNIILQSKNQ